MVTRSGPILETTVVVDASAVDFGDWLKRYAEESRSDAGVTDARVFTSTVEDGTAFVLQMVFDSDEAIDEFLAGRAASLEADIDESSDGTALQSTRVLREDLKQNLPGMSRCLNCDTPLRGQYCGVCGQRARGRLISLWELVRDAFGDLFELDSRLWQTVVPLLFRPGRLTADYLKGKRARYMPPFRSYLVLSLLFFVVAFFDPRSDLAILFPDEAISEPAAVEPGEGSDVDERSAAGAEADNAADAIEAATTDAATSAALDNASRETRETVERALKDAEQAIEKAGEERERSPGIVFNDDGGDCNIDDADLDEMPGWLKRRLTKERLTHICEQVQLDEGAQIVDNLLDNIPAALIVLLPLMALVLQILYPLSRRYYVEHLLFFVHYHAFFFLILTLEILWARITSALSVHEALRVIPIVMLSFYIPIYLFKAMRRVYGQGFLLTLLKYVVLVTVYVFGIGATMLGALLLAAFSI